MQTTLSHLGGIPSAGWLDLNALGVVLGGIVTARDKVRRTRLFVRRVDVRRVGREKGREAVAPVEEKVVVIHSVFS